MTTRVLSDRDGRALDAALQHAALFGRDDRVAVTVRGRDRVKLLHAMLTQEVKALPPWSVKPAALCDAQGVMLAAFSMVLEPERVVLWTDRPQGELLAATLDRYVIADDVEVALDEDLALVGLVGPEAPGVLAALGLALPDAELAAPVQIASKDAVLWQQVTGGRSGSPHGEGVPELLLSLQRDDLGDVVGALVAHGAAIGCHAAADALRVLAGVPLLGQDIDDGSTPLEAGLAATVSYRKGCYLGQEAIAMMTYRGQMRRHLCWVQATGSARPDVGWALRTPDGKRAGRMGTAVVLPDGRCLGLAMVPRKAYVVGGELVAASEGGETASVRILGTTAAGALSSGAEPA